MFKTETRTQASTPQAELGTISNVGDNTSCWKRATFIRNVPRDRNFTAHESMIMVANISKKQHPVQKKEMADAFVANHNHDKRRIY